jgi:glycine/D-amino acid oxidase-like deaminating enzyme
MENEASVLSNNKIAILGAGIVGLSTANRLVELVQENGVQNFSIDIIADKVMQETTSDGAGGLFAPGAPPIPGVSHDLLWFLIKNHHFIPSLHI